jgi:hypothetical protein
MATQQLHLRLPEDLVLWLREHVPPRARSAFVQRLLEQALPPAERDDDLLYQAALSVELDDALASQMRDWDVAVADALAAGA